ncbi:hypothetical protein BDV97DRAFT_348919 [Delphinella strobiligena]|nr:hypothetical protein BDV97DRAFT_348919 [Delphinella strobiligena]
MYNGSYSTTPTGPGNLHPTGPYSVSESIESRILPNDTSSYLSLPPSAGVSHPSDSHLPSGFNHTGSISSGPMTGASSDSYTRASFSILPWTGHSHGTGFPSSGPLSSNGSHPSGSGDRNGTYPFSTGAMTSGHPSVSVSRHHNSTSTITIKTTITISTHTVLVTTTITPSSSPESPVTALNNTSISPTGYVPSGGYTPSGGIASSSPYRNSTSPYVPVISPNSAATSSSTTHTTAYLNSSFVITLTTYVPLTTGSSTSSTLWSPATASSSPSPYRNSTISTVKTTTSTSNILTIPTTGYPGSNTNGEQSGTFPAYSVPSRSIPSNGFSSYSSIPKSKSKSSNFLISPITASNSSGLSTTVTSYTFPTSPVTTPISASSEPPDISPFSQVPSATPPGFSVSYTAGNRTRPYKVPTLTAYSSSSVNTVSMTMSPSSGSAVSPVTASTSTSIPILTSVPVYWPPVSFATSAVVASSSVVVDPAGTSGPQGYGGWGGGWWRLFK